LNVLTENLHYIACKYSLLEKFIFLAFYRNHDYFGDETLFYKVIDLYKGFCNEKIILDLLDIRVIISIKGNINLFLEKTSITCILKLVYRIKAFKFHLFR